MTHEIKRDRVAYSKSLLQSDDNCDPRRLHEVVTGDETWVHHYEPERTAQSTAWEPKERKKERKKNRLKLQEEIDIARRY